MKLFFDRSVLAGVFYADHQHHDSSARVFLNAGTEDFCALRTLGEVYATLTGLPVRPRITGPEGVAIVKRIRDRLTLVSLSEQEYVSTLETASSTIIGNAADDALIARCPIKGRSCRAVHLERPALRKAGTGCCRFIKTAAEI